MSYSNTFFAFHLYPLCILYHVSLSYSVLLFSLSLSLYIHIHPLFTIWPLSCTNAIINTNSSCYFYCSWPTVPLPIFFLDYLPFNIIPFFNTSHAFLLLLTRLADHEQWTCSYVSVWTMRRKRRQKWLIYAWGGGGAGVGNPLSPCWCVSGCAHACAVNAEFDCGIRREHRVISKQRRKTWPAAATDILSLL